MGKLIYAAIASADLFVEDAKGAFDWAMPDEEVHRFVNALERPISTYLYGRRLYETMAGWQTMRTVPGSDSDEFATLWRAADKIVYSTTLAAVATPRTKLERRFDPAAIRALKASGAGDLSIGGAALAGQALQAGLVDELHLILVPILIGSGKKALPDVRTKLELLSERRFASGFAHLHYRVV
jgi:dihydrofolate reductase